MFQPFQFAVLLLRVAGDRARAVRREENREFGASALEWAVISAIVVTAAVVIGGIIYNIVQTKGQTIQQCGTAAANNTNANC